MSLLTSLLRVCFLLSNLLVFARCCHTFRDTLVIANQRDGPQFTKRITGCLERISFDGQAVTEVFIRNQNVPVFDVDAIRHMVKLTKVSIWKSRLNEIKPGAFRNVPRLEQVYINYCNLSQVPKGVFNPIPTLVQVRLHNNEISTIDDEAFTGLDNLRRFNISVNRLVEFKPAWFGNSSKLETLDFEYNHIEAIPEDALSGFPILKYVYFGHNEISTIGIDAFNGIDHMQHLGLEFNRLVTISPRVFPNNIRIITLHLEANGLRCVSEELMAKVASKDVYLFGNPLHCNCLDELRLWVSEAKGKLSISQGCDVETLPICIVPTSVSCDNCSGAVDTDVARFFNEFRNHGEEVLRNCVRLD